MSNEIEKFQMPEVPAWVELPEHRGAGKDDIHESVTPIVHLCQMQSPEVVTRAAQAGDMVIRPFGTNLGTSCVVVVLASTIEWIKWNDREEGGGVQWRGRYDQLTDEQRKETVWIDGEPPAATETRSFLAVEYDSDGDRVDPRVRGPMIFSMSRSSARTGRILNQRLAQFGGGGAPIYALAVNISTKFVDGERGPHYIYEAAPAGAVKSQLSASMLGDLRRRLMQR